MASIFHYGNLNKENTKGHFSLKSSFARPSYEKIYASLAQPLIDSVKFCAVLLSMYVYRLAIHQLIIKAMLVAKLYWL